MRMGGKPLPFGIDEECITAAVTAVLDRPELQLTGVHVFAGTQILDAAVLLDQYRHAVRLGRCVAEQMQKPLETLDFGGGWGIPYFRHEQPLDLDRVRTGFGELINEIERDRWLSSTRIIVEPGRFLVGSAGLYLTRITDVKRSRGKLFAIADGGMHHHLAASGNLGQTIKRNYPVTLLNKLGRDADGPVDVVGPLCTPLDVLGRSLELPDPQIGDIVGVFQSGAYARSASPLNFLSHPPPPEVLVDDGSHSQIRRRGQPSDLTVDQSTD